MRALKTQSLSVSRSKRYNFFCGKSGNGLTAFFVVFCAPVELFERSAKRKLIKEKKQKKIIKKNLKKKILSFYMTSFDYLWVLLEPKKEYEPVRKRCLQLWETFTLEKQRRIYRTIRNRKKEHLFQRFKNMTITGPSPNH